jgi:Alanyl-tRNA synthetase
MTEEIFRRDSYAFEFEAVVVSAEGEDVELDITAFYPGGGGQVCDTGTIRGSAVTEVFYKGKKIIHRVPNNDIKAGERVWCSVDWDRRYDLMMGHTGEHLLFCSLRRQIPDLTITKIFIAPESKYVIVDRDVSWEDIEKALIFANNAIRENLPITKSLMSRDDPDLENVRIKMERIPDDEEISVVAIGDIDLSACSGIHVMETGELESIFVDRKASAGKDGIAIHFKVGDQAKDSAMALAGVCLRAVEATGSKPEDLVRTVSNTKEELQIMRRSVSDHVKRLIDHSHPYIVNEIKIHNGLFPQVDRAILTDAAEAFKNEGSISILISVGSTASVIMSSGVDSIDCSEILTKVLKQLGGRGGGKKDFAQGGIPDPTMAENALNMLIYEVVPQL